MRQESDLLMNSLDKKVDEFCVKNEIPGMSVSVFRNRKLLYSYATGFADIEKSIPFDGDTSCRLGSISKGFTALGIAKLVDKKLLKISDLVVNLMPEEIRKAMLLGDSRWNSVSVEHLLLHRSGLGTVRSDVIFAQGDQAAKEVRATGILNGNSLIAWGLRKPLDEAPNSKFQYSNLGYVLLARVIESVSGKPYAKFMNEDIFVPCGAKSFSIGRFRPDELGNKESHYYSKRKSKVFWNRISEVDSAYSWDLTSGDGAGGWVCTSADLARVMAFIVSGRLISTATLNYFFEKIDGIDQVRAGWAVGRGSDNGVQVFNFLGIVMKGNFGFAEWKFGYGLGMVANHAPDKFNPLDLERDISAYYKI